MLKAEMLEKDVERKECHILSDLSVAKRLRAIAGHPGGIREFGVLFHPVRSSFVHTCFLAGARSQMHEVLWSGLARNLYEEAGGGVTLAHNELYRRFLKSVGVTSDEGIRVALFAAKFNQRWRTYIEESPVEEAILAIAIYEIFDRPDYRTFLEAFSGIDDRWDLEFFRVHAGVEHFDMFSEFVDWLFRTYADAEAKFYAAADFVLGEQRAMWTGLLEALEAPLPKELGFLEAEAMRQ